MLKWPGFDCGNKYKLVENPNVKNAQSSNYCNHIVETIIFRWNDDVVPCCYDLVGDYVIGNIME